MADDPQAVTPPQATPPPSATDDSQNLSYVAPPAAVTLAPIQHPFPGDDQIATIPSQLTSTIPSDPIQHHMSWLGRILDSVGSILGGDTTYRLTKAADGSMSIAPDASTRGEKWGRVAAAALGGLAAGLPQSFGPAGVAQGAAAGFQAGAQQPAQQRQSLQQQADFQNKQLTEKANRVFLQQRMVQQILTNQALGVQMDQDEVARNDQLNKDLQASPWHDDVGFFKDMDAAMQAAKTDPQILKDHAQARHKIVPVYNRDRTVKGFQVYNMDPALTDMWNDQPLPIHKITLTPDANGILKPTKTQVGTIQPHGIQMGAYNNAEDKVTTDLLAGQQKYATTVKDLREPAGMSGHLTTSPGATAALITQKQQALAAETDPVKRQQLQSDIDSLTTLHAQQLKDVLAGRPVNYQQVPLAEGGVGYINPRNPTAPPIATPNILPKGQAPWPTTGLAAQYTPGTEGINPKTIGKVPSDSAKAARLGRSAIMNSQRAIQVLQQHPELVGRLNSLGSRWQEAVGISGDDPLAQLIADVKQSTIASLGAHNLRSSPFIRDDEDQITNRLKNDPASIITTLQERINSNQQFDDEERNYLNYGTPRGPQAPPNRQQNQNQPPANKGTRSIGAVRQALPQFKNSTDDEIRNALKQQGYNAVP